MVRRPLIFDLNPLGCLHSFSLTPTYSITFLMRMQFLFRPFWFTPTVSGIQLESKWRAVCSWSY